MKVLISGGGTGGHVFPAIAIANIIKERHPDAEILFVGAENRMEMERVPAAGYQIVGLPVAGFDRHRLWRNIPVVFKLMRSLMRARSIVGRFKPDIAVGVGGYASGPVLKECQRRGIPTLLQEQNSYAGVTNKLLAKKAAAICCAYEGMDKYFPARSIVLTGNPVRQAILQCTLTQAEAKKALGFDPARPLLMIVGGSLGARTVNRAVEAAVDGWQKAGIQVLWQTGKKYYDDLRHLANSNIHVQPFIADMATAYRAADLVVSRAGATTISELQLLGKAAILVPSPNVSEDHQRKNAQALVNHQAAVMILDADAVEHLGAEVGKLLADSDKVKSLSDNILKMALPDADEKILEQIEKNAIQ